MIMNRPKNLTIPDLRKSEISRFWSYVKKSTSDECWLWIGGSFEYGRGSFWFRNKTYKAPRIAYFLSTGIDPGDKMVCHTCDTPACCNPKHLYAGYEKDNSKDRVEHGQQARGEKQGLSKLTVEDVKIIRRLYAEGNISQRDLARQFGVSQYPITQIVNCRTWRHVNV